MTASMMLRVFEANANLWKMNKERNVFVSLDFHQETAAYYLPELARALKLIEDFSQKNQIPLHYTVNPHKQGL